MAQLMAPSSDTRQLRPLRPRVPSTKLRQQAATPENHTDEEGEEAGNQDLATRPYSTPRLRNVLLFCLGFRAVLGLVGQRTFFQPDEYYQSLEPAHRFVWGTGFETWEWRAASVGDVQKRETHFGLNDDEKQPILDTEIHVKDWKAKLRDRIIQNHAWRQLLLGSSTIDDTQVDSDASRPLNGLLRSWVWPLLFALPYWVLKVTGLDKVGPLLVSSSQAYTLSLSADRCMSDSRPEATDDRSRRIDRLLHV